MSMKILDSNFSIYLDNVFNFNNILTNWNNSFTYIYELLKQNKKISINLKEYIKHFEHKFPDNFKIISNINKFNQQKIKDATYNNTEDILNVIDDETLVLKNNLDEIDKKLEDLTFSRNLQITFLEDINKLYNIDEYFVNNSSKYIEVYNKYYDIVGNINDEYTANGDCIQSFINFIFLTNIFNETTNFRSMISNYLVSFDIINRNSISNVFNNILNINILELKEILTNTILTHNYQTVYPAPKVKKIISDTINDNIQSLKDEFIKYININYIKYNTEFARYLTDTCIHGLSKDILVELIKDGSSIIDIYNSSLNITEERMFDFYLNKVNEFNIKNHMFLLYIYRFWIYQFLNVMPIIMQNYVIRHIYNDEETNIKISKRDINGFVFKYVSNNINYENYANLLNSYYQNQEYLLDNINNNQCVDFSLNIFFIKLFDGFLESEQFTNFMTKLLRNIFDNLRKDGIVNYNYDWYSKFIYVILFFKTFLRKKLTDRTNYLELKDNINSMLKGIIISGVESIKIEDEEVEGTLGYDNLAFTTLHRFNKDGFILKLVNFDDTITIIDPSLYVLDSDNQSIIFITSSPEGKKLLASYNTDYNMKVRYLLAKELTDLIRDEELQGEVDGINKIFYTEKQYNLNSLELYLIDSTGKHEISPDDYIMDNLNKRIDFYIAPIGRRILANYHVITVNELDSNAVNINYIYKSLLTEPTMMDYIYQFMDSLYYSSLIKEITFNIMNNFYLK